MATLEFTYAGYTGNVQQTNAITILGEEHTALVGDEIVVDVPLDKFKKVLQYKNNWTTSGDATGSQPLPGVLFRPLEASTELSSMFSKLSGKGSGPVDSASRKWTDDASVVIPKFGNELLKIVFTNSILDSESLPRESIRAIVEGDLTVDSLTSTVLSNLNSEETGLAAGTKSLLEGLFEQAISADRVKGGDNGTDCVSGYKSPSFQVDDKISFLVKYTFTKHRTYALDTDLTSGNTVPTARMTTVGGKSLNLDGVDEIASLDKTYVITLRSISSTA